ncbi:MAG: M20/M25/M40 family metallo-hydrolase [Bacteroidales bacterium]|nr:M20/M25/M40 family metallo-hydrolase [Bacteroidales bacterium]
MKRLSPVIAIALLLALSCQSRNDVSTKADPVISDALAQVNIDSVRTYIDDLVALHTRHTLSTQTDPERGLGAAIAYLERRCGRWAQSAPAGRPAPRIERVYYTAGENGGRYDRVVSVPELMVTLPGTDGARELILMAHIDTRVLDVMDSTAFAPGADDDGSGVACLLETVRILSQIPLEQTVKCLFVSGEEQGLDGSRHFAAKAREEGWPVHAVLSNDMIGNSRASGTELHEDHKVRVFSESRNGEDTDSRQLARYIKETAGIYVPDQEVVLNYRSDRYGRGGDQRYFQREGFTAVRVCEYCEDYERTHQDVRTENGTDYGDLAKYVDFPYLVRNIKVNLAAVMSLAQAPATPAKVRIANAGDLDNNTILTWEPVLGKDGRPDTSVTYQILCRETSDSEWMAAMPMGIQDRVAATAESLMEYTCPLSKDNYFFAVRALSADGHPGLPAVAQ